MQSSTQGPQDTNASLATWLSQEGARVWKPAERIRPGVILVLLQPPSVGLDHALKAGAAHPGHLGLGMLQEVELLAARRRTAWGGEGERARRRPSLLPAHASSQQTSCSLSGGLFNDSKLPVLARMPLSEDESQRLKGKAVDPGAPSRVDTPGSGHSHLLIPSLSPQRKLCLLSAQYLPSISSQVGQRGRGKGVHLARRRMNGHPSHSRCYPAGLEEAGSHTKQRTTSHTPGLEGQGPTRQLPRRAGQVSTALTGTSAVWTLLRLRGAPQTQAALWAGAAHPLGTVTGSSALPKGPPAQGGTAGLTWQTHNPACSPGGQGCC